VSAHAFFRHTELDRTTYPAWRDHLVAAEVSGAALPGPPRCYPGYPRWPLPRRGLRWWPSLDRVLARRRCRYPPGTGGPTARVLGRVLERAHGISGADGRGPVPSAGGLQSLELYLAYLDVGWLPAGYYHYDRVEHALAQLVPGCTREDLLVLVPSLAQTAGGALVWIVVGDGERVTGKYGARGLRFLLLEAGHLMQNLCLLSESLGLVTIPLGGFFEADLAARLHLPPTDEVLYLGLCGPLPAGR
jgi:SagB-type dehydrogenase family enzyme